MTELHLQVHASQYGPGASAVTRRAGCTWSSGANGVAATTGSAKTPTPDEVHALLRPAEETSPETPGWSLPDLVGALERMGVELVDHTGEGWAAVTGQLDDDHYVVLQGDSDQFAGSTCSGAFDGPHCIGLHPRSKVDERGKRWRWVNDPICTTGRWERESVLRAYAESFHASIRFAAFAERVPEARPATPPAKPVKLAHGGRRFARPHAKRVRVGRGRRANVRQAPRTTARVVAHRSRGKAFTAWQVTETGQRLAGSSRWYGNRLGTRWIHSSAFRGGTR